MISQVYQVKNRIFRDSSQLILFLRGKSTTRIKTVNWHLDSEGEIHHLCLRISLCFRSQGALCVQFLGQKLPLSVDYAERLTLTDSEGNPLPNDGCNKISMSSIREDNSLSMSNIHSCKNFSSCALTFESYQLEVL